ncbi:MAG: nitroreductase family protein [Desulfobacterales bacterium]|nr:nitroreductase family protein [Desulfobacterales bacterium]
MTDLMSIIKGRRSIRRYQDKEIPQEIIEQLLDSIRWSPSWANTQCWEIVIVKDPATKEKLKETIGSTNPSSKGIVEAPLVFAICGKVKSSGYYKGQTTTKFGDWLLFDLGIATQSLCLTAFDAGLGTVIIGMLDHDKAKEILGVEEEYEVVALIPVGYPAKESAAPKRREIGEFTHYGKF